MKLLVAGVGLIGRRHLEHALAMSSIEVVGVIDPAPVDVGVARFADIAAVDVEADAILIATPSSLHMEHARQAAQRGWHMMIEKPVASDLEGADQIIADASKAGVQTLVGHHRRHHSHVAKLKQIVDSGAIGQPVTASLIWAMKKPDPYFDIAWRSGADGSPVMINLVHEVDTLRFLFGDVTHVSGLGSNALRGARREESGVATLGFGSGVIASITFADTTPSPWGFEAGTGENPNIATTGQDALFITGTKGAISFPSMTVWSGAEDWSQAPQPRIEEVEANVPLVTQLEHFVEVVAGRVDPIVDAREGRKTLAATLAIAEAVQPCGDAS